MKYYFVKEGKIQRYRMLIFNVLIILALIIFIKKIEIVFFAGIMLFILHLAYPKHYSEIYSEDGTINFLYDCINQHLIKIPILDIVNVVIHSYESKGDSSWIYLIDKYGRHGGFHFVSSKEMFDKVEDFFRDCNVDCVRIYNNYENIKEAYKI